MSRSMWTAKKVKVDLSGKQVVFQSKSTFKNAGNRVESIDTVLT
jgi:hypothetical protein